MVNLSLQKNLKNQNKKSKRVYLKILGIQYVKDQNQKPSNLVNQ